jgi:hypothetical protein
LAQEEQDGVIHRHVRVELVVLQVFQVPIFKHSQQLVVEGVQRVAPQLEIQVHLVVVEEDVPVLQQDVGVQQNLWHKEIQDLQAVQPLLMELDLAVVLEGQVPWVPQEMVELVVLVQIRGQEIQR